MAICETATFRGSRSNLFRARWNDWRFRHFFAICQPGTAAIWRSRFPVGSLFAWRHDVVSVRGSATTNGSGRSTGRTRARSSQCVKSILDFRRRSSVDGSQLTNSYASPVDQFSDRADSSGFQRVHRAVRQVQNSERTVAFAARQNIEQRIFEAKTA